MAIKPHLPAVPIKKASELSGLSPHMITYLGRIEILIPSGNLPGRGRRRLFTFSDVLFLRMIADLLSRGIEVKRLGQGLRRIKEEADLWLEVQKRPRWYLVTDGAEVMLRRKGRLESKTADGQFVFSFVLDMEAAHAPLASAWPRQSARANGKGRAARSHTA
ncbi:MAG: MerR family transcriptional regulator [Sphingomonadaceae bacterium]|jgi:DNA-binding transcriptional MerR regulator|nr:MerR family transcriptional regulator [Sphingomonadaceae bacterium]